MPKIRGIKPDFWTDEDIVELTPLARLLYIGMWNYACDNGHLEDRPKQLKMRILPADDCSVADLLRELVEKGRITRREGWLTIPNLGDHQRIDKRFFSTCDMAECSKPEAESGNPKRKTRRAHIEDATGAHMDHASTPGDGDGEFDGEGDGEGDGEKTRGLTPVEVPRGDVDRICDHLAQRIEANGSKRPTITKGWRDAARLMLDRDRRAESDVHTAIDWCQNDEFWRTNILSLPKLREQYDRLRLAASRGSAPRRNDIDWDAAFERAASKTAGGIQ